MRVQVLFALLLAACTAGPASPHATAPSPAPAPPSSTRPTPAPPFAEGADPSEPGDSDHLVAPESPSDVCVAADTNLQRDLDAVLALAPPSAPARPRATWDRRATPERLDLVDRRLRLRPEERATLMRQGLVVPARLAYDTYAWAFHDVYQSQLPLYVSADAVLHAVYITNDRLIAEVEASRLAPMLSEAVDAMHAALPDAADTYPPDVARDLDLYLTVARSLLRASPVPSGRGNDAQARELLSRIEAAQGALPVTIFGRERVVDFSQYLPRGHYTGAGLSRFFRGAMWLSRMEFNVVSRSCRSSDPVGDPAETPREALDALGLSDLASRAGVTGSLERIERAWEALAGRREDLSARDLASLRAQANITSLREPDAFERLRAAIGDGFRRTARIHPMGEGCGDLPVIATMLGPRITADTFALRPIVHTEVPDRRRVSAEDVAYVLGHDRARAHLASELARFPTLGAQLEVARGHLASAPPDRSLYGAWLGAIRGLSARTEGVLPSYTEGDAFADLRINSAVSAYAQLRHNYVLMAGQAYDEGGCEIPDTFVEPAPAVWDGLVEYTDRALEALGALGEGQSSEKTAWLRRTRRVLRGLRAITALELANQPLPPEAQRFLAMVVEMRPGSSDGPPTYSGWYFDLFRRRQEEGLADARMIADFYTSWFASEVAYVGVERPRLGLFVVDTAGAPRVFVGPVAAGYGYHGSAERRLDDEAARALTRVERPWAASYEVPAPEAPPLWVRYASSDDDPSEAPSISLRSARPLGAVTIELLDHHRQRVRAFSVRVGAGTTRVSLRGAPTARSMRVRVGDWDEVVGFSLGGGEYTFGGMRAPSTPSE